VNPYAAAPRSARRNKQVSDRAPAAAARSARRSVWDEEEDDQAIPKKQKTNSAVPDSRAAAPRDDELLSEDELDFGGVGEGTLVKALSRGVTPPTLSLISQGTKFLTAVVGLSNCLPQALWTPQRSTFGHAVDASSHLSSSINSIIRECGAYVQSKRLAGVKPGTMPGLTAKVNNAVGQAIAPLYQYQKVDFGMNVWLHEPILPVVCVTDTRYYHGFAVQGSWIYDSYNGSTHCVPLTHKALRDLGYLIPPPEPYSDDEMEMETNHKKKNKEASAKVAKEKVVIEPSENVAAGAVALDDEKKASSKGDEEEENMDPEDFDSWILNPLVVQYAISINKDWVDAMVKSDKDRADDKAKYRGGGSGGGGGSGSNYPPSGRGGGGSNYGGGSNHPPQSTWASADRTYF
jgi:uncharacterized membrane protein YgcG